MLTFKVLTTDAPKPGSAGTFARRGTLTLNHGVVQTPIFMPVGTYGTVKGSCHSSCCMGAQSSGSTPFTCYAAGVDVMQQLGVAQIESGTNPPDDAAVPGCRSARCARSPKRREFAQRDGESCS